MLLAQQENLLVLDYWTRHFFSSPAIRTPNVTPMCMTVPILPLTSTVSILILESNRWSAVADPDLQGGGGGTPSSKPWDRRGMRSQKNSALWSSIWSRNKGGGSPFTRSATEVFIMTLHYLDGFSSFHRLLWRDASFTFTKQLLHKESDVATSYWNVLYTTTNDISLSL